MELAECLAKAADLIEESGWVQGQMFTPDGKHCLFGAVVAVCPTLGTEVHINAEVRRGFMSALSFQTTHGAMFWNDLPGRTKEEVVARLREGAKAAANKGE